MMNNSAIQDPSRQLQEALEEPDRLGPLGGHQSEPKGDGLPLLAIIVTLFVLVAICIIMVVHFGPELRKIQVTLPQEPSSMKQEGGVRLIHWQALGSQLRIGPQESYRETQPGLAATSLCTHSNIRELTYL
ncbi:small integral membrane protein 33 [Gracilinanus agilis]|uniref:small integral membrane protein 33 n=1 Tax=Gracilinanus agilis TaxID=191870 RepID=UPI001CFC7B08|nr:small integral membrane protein 33 [Gracilinanus agilis]